MFSMQRRTLLTAGMALATALTTPAALAQSYPSKAIKLIVPYAAGGATDITARTLGEKLATGWVNRCWWTTVAARAA